MAPDRRDFLLQALRGGSGLAVGGTLLAHLFEGEAWAGVEVVPFVGEGRAAVGKRTGTGLSGRLALDLTQLSPRQLITPTSKFFVRTHVPRGRKSMPSPWSISIEGQVRKPMSIDARTLASRARDQGVHLLECSGNGRNRGFGLISAARWRGVRLRELFAQIAPKRGSRVRVEGLDDHPKTDGHSSVGAGWVFTVQQLVGSGAFLATHMNGAPLTLDHGFPARLVVPGWYGCVAVKWVQRIRFVPDDVAATSQMREFATRTHQRGVPRLARHYKPAIIDLTAMPVAVTRQRRAGPHRIVGVLWGGTQRTNKLEIRVGSDPWQRVRGFTHNTNKTWTLWQHTWRPRKPGTFAIRMRVADKRIRTRRLDHGHYVRVFRSS